MKRKKLLVEIIYSCSLKRTRYYNRFSGKRALFYSYTGKIPHRFSISSNRHFLSKSGKMHD